MTTPEYQILLTPLIGPSEYGSVINITEDIDISDWIQRGGLTTISAEIDQGDYDVGVFRYGNISIKAINYAGKFNEPQIDSRSIFPWYRDRAKVKINFIDSNSSANIVFRGLISDKATVQDLISQTVKFTILSQDSIFERVQVSAGAIIPGMTFTQAFQAALNVSEVTDVLGFDSSNINPKLDLTLDATSSFDNVLLKTVLDRLLLASNSVLLIDGTDITIRSRDPNSNTPHNFFLYDEHRRDNIDSITDYNNGLQRMFNSIFINDTESSNSSSKKVFFVREKRETLDFITNTANEQLIADSMFEDFGLPKAEMKITADTETFEDVGILDKVTVKKGLKLRESTKGKAGLYEIDEYEKSYYTEESGDIELNGNIVYKVVGIFKNPATFKTTLKIRETGEIL